MKLQFKHQNFKRIQSCSGCFAGQPYLTPTHDGRCDISSPLMTTEFLSWSNETGAGTDPVILEHIQKIQRTNRYHSLVGGQIQSDNRDGNGCRVKPHLYQNHVWC